MATEKITWVVAGLPVQIESENAELLMGLANRYTGFLGDDHCGGFRVRVSWQAGDRSANEGFPPVEFGDRVRLIAPGYGGEICLEEGAAYLELSSRQPVEDVDYFLRLICAFQIFQAGGLLLHCAGIIRNGLAHIFFGKSGSGKTTVAQLTDAGVVLNDDLVALMPLDSGWMAYATPFTNSTQVPPQVGSAQVAGLYRLVQDQKVYLEEISQATALAELIASVPIVASYMQKVDEVIVRCRRLADACPLYRLHFRKDAEFWRAIENRDQF